MILAAAAFAVATCVGRITAQEEAKTSPDSLAERLERAEEELAMLRQQMADQAQTGVQTRSRATFELNGRVLMNAYTNSRRVNILDVPLTVRSDTANGLPQGGLGMTVRQSTLGFSTTVADVLGAAFAGDLQLDFCGGQYDANTTPVVRLRIARATLRWKHVQLMIGQDDPLISALNPLSLAAVGLPEFSRTGNLWAWLPQVRLGLETAGTVRYGVQGALLAPSSGGVTSSADNDVAQQSRRPFVEARAHVGWGENSLAGDVGVGAHAGWMATPRSTRLRESRGIAADALVPLTKWLELRGEWYSGEGMSVLAGGAIGQLFDTKDQPIHSTGMWGQVNLHPTSRVTVGAGFGMDDPDDANLAAAGPRRNTAAEVHVHVRPAGPLVLGFEYRRIATSYAAGQLANDHLNLALGFEF